MTETESYQAAEYVELSASIVAAYVANNSIPTNELGPLLARVHAVVSSLGERRADATAKDEATKLTSAQIKKSITPDALISFEDGKAYKALRRHLTTRGLTPEAYKAKWGLSPDYPMTAASYSAARSELARSLGFGRQRKGAGEGVKAKAARLAAAAPEAPVEVNPKRMGPSRKAAAE